MNKHITITIDSQDAKKTTVSLVSSSMNETLTHEGTNTHSQVILPLIERALEKHGCTLDDIAAITVQVDHGSFTGRRVGVAIATMLGALLHVPVNGLPTGSPITIPYEEDRWK